MEDGPNGMGGMAAQQHVVVEFATGPDNAPIQLLNMADVNVAQMVPTTLTGSCAMSMPALALVCISCIQRSIKNVPLCLCMFLHEQISTLLCSISFQVMIP